MSAWAIRASGLGKRYRLGQPERYHTLRDTLAPALLTPWTLFRREKKPVFWALEHVDLTVKQGEVLGLIGRNGAGKTTLLKILGRITRPTRGWAEIHGRVGSLLEIGTGFHPELSGRDNIYLSGAILGMPRREITRKFDEIVAFAEIERFLDTQVKHYSSGMYLRLAFAVAAHLETEILLVDEVLAVGDIRFQKKCLGKMGSVARDGRTVMFVSHHMAAVQQLCSRVFLVRAGTISLQGEPEAVLSRYLNDAIDSREGDFDLTSHPARSTRHRSIIRRLRLYSSAGEPTCPFYPEEALIDELTLDPPAPIRGPQVAMAIEDSFGRRIMTLASYFHGSGLSSIARPTRIRCKLAQL